MGGTDALSYLFNGGTDGAGGPESVTSQASPPEGETMVLLSDVEGEEKSVVRIGQVKYYPKESMYRMVDGAVEFPLSSKQANGKFVTTQGTYRGDGSGV